VVVVGVCDDGYGTLDDVDGAVYTSAVRASVGELKATVQTAELRQKARRGYC